MFISKLVHIHHIRPHLPQLIFRHLFFYKHVERRLQHTWHLHQQSKELNVQKAFAKTFALRHRMLHFLQNLGYYMTVEVVEPNWLILEKRWVRAAGWLFFIFVFFFFLFFFLFFYVLSFLFLSFSFSSFVVSSSLSALLHSFGCSSNSVVILLETK